MKINQDLRVGLKTNHNEIKQVNQSGNRFGEMVVKQGSKMQTEQLTRLLGDISSAGDRVARSRNLRELARFKMLVRRFLQEAVNYGLEMKQSHTWNRFGEGRRLKIVETIDERLVELAEDLLNEEKATIDLLDKIGEIKGLLVNLYT
ncbi:YaaR family protein [Ureibacillus composti]|nr:YaaR family protein [Ureibacillus composti]